MKFFFWTCLPFLFLALSCSNSEVAKTSAKPLTTDPEMAEEAMMKGYSLAELGEALNIMRVVLDRASKKSEFCDITPSQASLMSQQLKFMIEEKAALTKRPNTPMAEWKDCNKACNCYVYAHLYQEENDYFNQALKDTTSMQAYQCAKNVNWFCGSSLHQHLLSLSSAGEANY